MQDTDFALGRFSSSIGIFERLAIYPSRSAEEMDRIVSRSINWTAPGSR